MPSGSDADFRVGSIATKTPPCYERPTVDQKRPIWKPALRRSALSIPRRTHEVVPLLCAVDDGDRGQKLLHPPHVLGTLHRRQRGRDADVIRGAIIALRRPVRMSACGYEQTLDEPHREVRFPLVSRHRCRQIWWPRVRGPVTAPKRTLEAMQFYVRL